MDQVRHSTSFSLEEMDSSRQCHSALLDCMLLGQLKLVRPLGKGDLRFWGMIV